ncbi:L-fuculose-phosphate aldolase [Lentibacillus halophilus]|uniref:L-fuculose-phosphate aldolase n=1 Tax=Lentibacillus halophilus TaxID=295065 RepID=A0ABN0Z528_9BACI
MDIKKDVLDHAKKCYDNGLTIGTSGNVSLKDGHVMYITPSALPYNEMIESDILKVDIETGDVLEGERKASSETSMHRYIYMKDTDIKAIVHTHSTYATVFACAQIPIPPVHYTIADIGREVPVAPYALFGSEKLAENAVNTLGDNNGVLLANHGVVSVGSSLKDAYRRAETIEEVAHLSFGSYVLNSVQPLSNEELDDVEKGFESYVSG